MKAFEHTDITQDVRTVQNEVADVPEIPLSETEVSGSLEQERTVWGDLAKVLGLTDGGNSKDYSEYLARGIDGKYYDRETGEAYDSVKDWVQAQRVLIKNGYTAAVHYEEKAKQEWEKYQELAENGGSEAEQQEHYKRCQEYTSMARKCHRVVERTRQKLGFSKEHLMRELGEMPSFDGVPEKRRDAVTDYFKDSPEGIRQVLEQLDDRLVVKDTKPGETSHYNTRERVIHMNPRYDDDEYAEVFSHEFGHFADHHLGNITETEEFKDAVAKDRQRFEGEEGQKLKQQMLEDLANSDAIDDRAVSDILSGMFLNDPEIQRRYAEEYAAYYAHDNDYWQVNDSMVGCEFFANAFSIYADPSRTDSQKFIEKYFPNTTNQFKDSVSI